MSSPSANGANPPASGVQQDKVNPSSDPSVNPARGVDGAQGRISADENAVRHYLTEVYGDVPGLLNLWTMPKRGSGRFFPTTDDGIEQAVQWIIRAWDHRGEHSIYARMTTVTHEPAEWKSSRGNANDSSHFLGFWSDVDYGTLGHKPGVKKDSLPNPPDAATAQAIYSASGLPDPTIMVHSGGGLYHHVLLAEPLNITDPELRKRITEMSRRWHQKLVEAAKKLGYKYDTGLHDVARVLRVPGTVNAKIWEQQRLCSAMYTGVRYTLEELEALVPEPPQPIRDDAGRLINPETGEIIAESRIVGRPTDGTVRPGDDFNERGDWRTDVLEPAGWTFSHKYSDTEYWTRPGKESRDGHSASLGWIPDRLWAWSAGDSGLTELRAYDKWTAYAFMAHGGDFSAAARDLAQRGYGTAMADRIPAPRDEADPQDTWGGQLDERGAVIVTAAEGHAKVTTKITEESFSSAGQEPESYTSRPMDAAELAETNAAINAINAASEPANEPDLPTVDITNERDAMWALTKHIQNGQLPEVYVRDGRLVHVGVVSGARNGRRRKPGAAAERQAPDMGPSQMRALISRHMNTIKFTAKGNPVSALPTESLCKAILAQSDWGDLADLTEITGMPFVRPDGTIRQESGYDPDTGIWLNVDEGFPTVPEKPTADDVAAAKKLLLDEVLRDFPFVTGADRANYLGLLLTPAMKQVVNGLSMFGVITAAAPASGKSLLAEIISRTYGGNGDATTLSRNDEEIRKLITTKLMSDPHRVVTFDNIGKSHVVDSPVLAQLLTTPVWSDRILGGNDNVSRINDKLWLATGNNVRLGGDMPNRSVFVRIDPKMERPESRDSTAFAVGNLQVWMTQEANRAKIMHALLVLIRAWAVGGMPRMKIEKRNFTEWAQNVGGLLDFHGITGFLSNTEEAEDADEEAYEWSQFLQTWQGRHGDTWMTTAQLIASHKSTQYEVMGGAVDPWQGTFPTKDNGQSFTPHGLGAKLKHIEDRPFQGWVVRRTVNKSTNQRLWRAEPYDAKEPEPEPEQMAFTSDTS